MARDRMPRHLARALAVALALVLAACGGSDEPTTAESGGSSASSGPSNQQDTARVKLARCLREQGLDVPDTTGHEAFARLSPAERQRLQEALDGPCSEFSSGAFGDPSDAQSEELLDAITAFTVCLREQGIDVPDPDPSSPFDVLHSLDQSDPTVSAAAAECQDELRALSGGG